MNDQEAKLQSTRIKKYDALIKVRDEIQIALEQVTRPDPSGPCGQNPFTGNTRESRQVSGMDINFTPTRGGAPAVSIRIANTHIEAWDLGKALAQLLGAKLGEVDKMIKEV